MKIIIVICIAFAIQQHLASPLENLNEKCRKNATITYTLWVGSSIVQIDTLKLTVPKNSTFFSVMKLAAGKRATYNFEAKEYPNLGNYITSIAGYEQDNVNNIYWMLYNLTSFPDLWYPPRINQLSPVGVDNLIVKDRHHYLFWYQYVHIVQPEV